MKIIRTVQPNASDVSFSVSQPAVTVAQVPTGFDPEAYMQQMTNMTMIIAQQQHMLNAMAVQQQQQFGGGGVYPSPHQPFHHNSTHFHGTNVSSSSSSTSLPKSKKIPAPTAATPAAPEFTSIVQNEPLPKSKKFSKSVESNTTTTTTASTVVDTQRNDGTTDVAVVTTQDQQTTQSNQFHHSYVRGGRAGGRYGRGVPIEGPGFIRGGRGRGGGGRFQQSYNPAAMLSPFAVNPTLLPMTAGATTDTPYTMGGGFRAPSIRGGRFSGRGSAGGRFPVSRTAAAGRGVITNKKWVRDTGTTANSSTLGDNTANTSEANQAPAAVN